MPLELTDVDRLREHRRQRRLLRLAAVLAPLPLWLWYRVLTGDPAGLPSVPEVDPLYLMSGAFFTIMILFLLGTTVVSGRSPHVVYRPEQLDVRFDDVLGLDPVLEDVRRSIDLLRQARTFRCRMGGTPRRGLLFEGPPGTGKTHLAKAMAAEAGVPFLFVSATSFQSMYYGATARKIRSYFAALRKAARAEGAAIGFIEEIDAIATVRGGMASAVPVSPSGGFGASAGVFAGAFAGEVVHCGGLTGLAGMAGPMVSASGPMVSAAGPMGEGVGGVVNELLIQMQSFDTPTTTERVKGAVIDAVNLFLPAHRAIPRPRTEPVDVLLIAATNRADSLDPGLLRPGRFDRRLVFSSPDKTGRRQLIDHFLARKAHDRKLAGDEHRDALAGITTGYTPVMIEHLLDEALVNAVRRGAARMSWTDVEHARLVTEVGLGQPVTYTDHERSLIATHEAGHAVMAWLVAPHRRLEVLTIVKRAGSLGLLAHGDVDDVYTRSRRELEGLIRIAFGGQVSEELFFGDVSTGPGGDLAQATKLAAQMVGAAGMTGSLVSLAAAGGGFGDAGLVSRVLSDERARSQVELLLAGLRVETRELLEANRHLVEALRDALLERHELIGHEITDILEAAGPSVVDVRSADGSEQEIAGPGA
ncbi:MAG: cell division protease FtsH [Actinomycetota bacterium]|nr:cell division protease FtsH [Actinomycetota bacterium]